MPLPLDINRYSFGASRPKMNLTDYLDNRNTALSERSPVDMYSPNTLNNIRASNSYKSGLDEMAPGTPGEQRVPNQPPSQTPMPAPPPAQQQDGSMGGNILQLAQLASTMKGQPAAMGSAQDTGQQPGTPFSFGSVNNPPPAVPAATPKLGETPDPYLLATILGAAGGAIGTPGSWQSRLGQSMAGIAAPMYQERVRREYEEPDVALDREYKRERLRQMKMPADERTDRQRELEFYFNLTPEKKAEYDKLYGKDGKISDIDKFNFYKGLDETDRTLWDKYHGKDGGFHYVQDDEGNVSVYKGRELVKGAGKGKSKTEKSKMTEEKARKELLNIAKYKQKLSETGGMDDILFAMIAQSNPEMAEKLRGSDKSEILDFITDQENYYRQFVKDLPQTKTEKTGTKTPSWKDYQ